MIKKGELYYPTKSFKKAALLNDKAIYQKAAKDPIKFWENLAESIFWRKKWTKAFWHKPPYFEWFINGKLNITESCLDRHLPAKKDKIAFIWEPEPNEEKPRIITYGQLFVEVCRFANVLKKLGVKKGDRVAIYMPMIPETIVAMLACARIGAIHAIIFSAFSPTALQSRLQDTKAKILITADGYYRRGQVINLKDSADQGIVETDIKKIVVVKRAGNTISWKKDKDFWYTDLMIKVKDFCPAITTDAEDPLFILYTSGSTGKPKGVIHICGGYAVQALWTAKWIFDLKDDDIFWSTADIGWITGHTYSCYGPLLNGITFIMFEGAPNWPSQDRWAKTIEKYKVTTFYTAPTAIRMFEKELSSLSKKELSSLLNDLKTLRLLGSVGEPIDKATWTWYFENVGKKKLPIVDTWWQTETGGILITSLPGIGPFKPAFTGLPFPGIKAGIFDANGKICKPDREGNLVILPPFSPGMLRGVYKNSEKYLNTYWSEYGPKVYFTSDAAFKNKNGLIRIVGRVDDVIKVAGHRLTSGELEEVINFHPNIVECAVIGIPDEIKGEALIVFAICKKNSLSKKQMKKEIIDQIKKEIGPIAIPKQVYIIPDLPKTRSGKIMRRILKKLLTGEELGDLSTLSNPEIVEKIKNKING